jgi:hypothetical protein
LVLVDADGGVVAPQVLQEGGGQPVYIDDAGYQWVLNPETATLATFAGSYRYFPDAGCVGLFYVDIRSPRQVFQVVTLDGGFVRPDNQVVEHATIQSVDDGTSCLAASPYDLRAIPASRLIPLSATPPNLNAVPPLHLERR